MSLTTPIILMSTWPLNMVVIPWRAAAEEVVVAEVVVVVEEIEDVVAEWVALEVVVVAEIVVDTEVHEAAAV